MNQDFVVGVLGCQFSDPSEWVGWVCRKFGAIREERPIGDMDRESRCTVELTSQSTITFRACLQAVWDYEVAYGGILANSDIVLHMLAAKKSLSGNEAEWGRFRDAIRKLGREVPVVTLVNDSYCGMEVFGSREQRGVSECSAWRFENSRTFVTSIGSFHGGGICDEGAQAVFEYLLGYFGGHRPR